MITRTIREASKDTIILWASACLRLVAYGSSNILLTLYLKSLGISETFIGIFMTCTLIGDTLISYLLTWNADRLGRRVVMIFGCLLMMISGLIFARFENYWILLVASIFGVISPSGDEVGPFKAIEESTIAHLTPLKLRSDVYALHWVFGTCGSAIGSLITGILITFLQDKGFDDVDSYRSIFYIYSIIGGLKLILMLFLSEKCEINLKSNEESPLLVNNDDNDEITENKNLSKDTISIMIKLCSIFMLDSFGSGFMSSAWMVYYFKTYFLISAGSIGLLFFITSICNSISALPSSMIAKKFGPVKATLIVQIPSAVFLSLIPWMPNFLMSSLVTIFFYSTSAMDVVPRQVLLTGLIRPTELTRVMGIVNICKTFARCIGPMVTGKLAKIGKLKFSFVISGGLIFCADLLLALLFYGIDEKILETHR